MEAVVIREARPGDEAAIASLMSQYWAFEQIEGFLEPRAVALTGWLLRDSNMGRGWLATESGRPVGYLLAVFVFSLELGGLMAEIDEFFIVPEARSRGTGAALLATAEAGLRTAGCVHLQLQLGVANESARRFYRRQGYARRAGYELLDKPL